MEIIPQQLIESKIYLLSGSLKSITPSHLPLSSPTVGALGSGGSNHGEGQLQVYTPESVFCRQL